VRATQYSVLSTRSEAGCGPVRGRSIRVTVVGGGREGARVNVTGLIVNLNSEQPERLTAFYRDTVGLPPEARMGESAFQIGPAHLIIDGHSEVHGPAAQPQRVLINLFVDDLAAEKARLDAVGVPFIRQPEREPWGGLIATFLDPDGNYLQLVEFRPS
jgi:predicted enzyme related to lactoylglutathione lyase